MESVTFGTVLHIFEWLLSQGKAYHFGVTVTLTLTYIVFRIIMSGAFLVGIPNSVRGCILE